MTQTEHLCRCGEPLYDDYLDDLGFLWCYRCTTNRPVAPVQRAFEAIPVCRCKERGGRVIESGSLAGLVVHLPDCAWLEWDRAIGGCQGDV